MAYVYRIVLSRKQFKIKNYKKKTYDVHLTHVNSRMNVDPHIAPCYVLSYVKKNGPKLLE